SFIGLFITAGIQLAVVLLSNSVAPAVRQSSALRKLTRVSMAGYLSGAWILLRRLIAVPLCLAFVLAALPVPGAHFHGPVSAHSAARTLHTHARLHLVVPSHHGASVEDDDPPAHYLDLASLPSATNLS